MSKKLNRPIKSKLLIITKRVLIIFIFLTLFFAISTQVLSLNLGLPEDDSKNYLLVSSGNSLYKVSEDGKVIERINLGMEGYFQWGLCLSPDGNRMLFGFNQSLEFNNRHESWWVINSDGTGKKDLGKEIGIKYGEYYLPFFSPDGDKILFQTVFNYQVNVHWRQDAWIINSDGTEKRNLSKEMEGGFIAYSSFSPDGKKIILEWAGIRQRSTAETDSLYVWTMTPDGKEKKVISSKNLTEGNDGIFFGLPPVFSPDGKKILIGVKFTIDDLKRPISIDVASIWSIDTEGIVKELVREKRGPIEWLSFSPDGKKILFAFNRVGLFSVVYPSIWIMNSDGTEKRNLTGEMKGKLWDVSFSPDGKKILFGFESEIWIMNPDGTEKRKFAHGSSELSFSPNGKKILVNSGDYYIMNSDGTKQIKLGKTLGMEIKYAIWYPKLKGTTISTDSSFQAMETTKPGDITYFGTAKPGTVQLSSPSNGTILPPGDITFSWDLVSNATKYEVMLYDSLGKSTVGTSSTSFTISLGTEETITWKVRAGDNSGNWGPWSSIWSLNVKSTNRNFKITDYQAKWKILENGDAQVSEIFTYNFDGIFNGIIRSIGTGGSDGLAYFQASEYSPQKKVLETTQNVDGDMVTFKIYDQSNNEKKSFLLEYKLKNVITKYNDIAEFYWKFFDQTNTSPIGNIKVEVEYFKEISKEKLNASAFGPLDGDISIQENGKVVYEVGRLSPGEKLGVRILYPIDTSSQVSETTTPLQGSMHCPDKAGYACPSCTDASGYDNHFKGFNILTTQQDCYVKLTYNNGDYIGNQNNCEVTIKGEKWLGLEDKSGTTGLVKEINRENFEFIPTNEFVERTMTFPGDHYQYEFADEGREFRLYLSGNVLEAFQAVPWQNINIEIKNKETNKVFTYKFEKGIFPQAYAWSGGVANYGQCVWWAAKRWAEEVDSQNLFPFYPPSPQTANVIKIESDPNYQPERFDILIDYIPGGQPGHYGFVEKVDEDLVYITQFNFIEPGEVYNYVSRFWNGNPKTLYYSINPHNEYYFKYYYRK